MHCEDLKFEEEGRQLNAERTCICRPNLLKEACVITAATLTIDLGAIVANWRQLAAKAGPHARCAAVVKADAYGLGAAWVAPALWRAGCQDFFVATLEEGLSLRRQLSQRARIYVLHGLLPGSELECAGAELIPILNSIQQIQAWAELGRKGQRALPAGLQIDTGMARLGLPADEFARLDARLLEGIEPVLLMSHLVSAEDPQAAINRVQLERFRIACTRWPQIPASLANSSGIFLGQEWHFNLLRPGAALYGVAPMDAQANPMMPVVRLEGRLLQTRTVAAGEGVGYNHTWHAPRTSRVATVSVGYADGFLRSLSNRGQLVFNGQRVAIVGRVSMDLVTVDVSAIAPELLVPGAPFELIGPNLDINALASLAGTNAYEMLTSLGPRYGRVYLPVSGAEEGRCDNSDPLIAS